MSTETPTLQKLKSGTPKQILLTSGASFAIVLALGISVTIAHKGFGSHDLIPFAIYSLPFALFNALAAGLICQLTQRLPLWLATSSAFLAGLVLGFLAPFVMVLSLGFLFGMMSVAVWQHWCVTAALICAASVVVRRTAFFSGGALVLAGLTTLSGGIWFGFAPLTALLRRDQELTYCFFQHHPGDSALRVPDSEYLAAADLELLKQTGLRGRLEPLTCGQEHLGTWPRARALVVLNTPGVEVSLPQPRHVGIAYLQTPNGF